MVFFGGSADGEVEVLMRTEAQRACQQADQINEAFHSIHCELWNNRALVAKK